MGYGTIMRWWMYCKNDKIYSNKFNTEMKLKQGYEDIFRISFVLYYRENMYKCKQPSEQLKDIKIDKGGYLKL